MLLYAYVTFLFDCDSRILQRIGRKHLCQSAFLVRVKAWDPILSSRDDVCTWLFLCVSQQTSDKSGQDLVGGITSYNGL